MAGWFGCAKRLQGNQAEGEERRWLYICSVQERRFFS
jgi:hypothetical protein